MSGILELLRCPRCGSGVREEGAWLVCTPCKLRYPVREGIPVMLAGEAVAVDGEDHGTV